MGAEGMDGVTSAKSSSRVAICLLGSFQVLKLGDPVSVRPGGKTELLLSRLALQEHNRASREWLLEVMWPESDLARASHALNSLIHATRKLLADALGGEPPVVSTGGGYELNIDAGVSVDVAEFDTLATRAEGSFRVGDVGRALPDSLAALTLYRGDLCVVRAAPAGARPVPGGRAPARDALPRPARRTGAGLPAVPDL
jgi:two-component SAPR family response regulator